MVAGYMLRYSGARKEWDQSEKYSFGASLVFFFFSYIFFHFSRDFFSSLSVYHGRRRGAHSDSPYTAYRICRYLPATQRQVGRDGRARAIVKKEMK